MKNKKTGQVLVTPPQLSTSPMLELRTIELVDDGDYGGFHLSGCAVANASVKDTVIETALFSQVSLGGSLFDTCRLSDIRFVGCDLSNAAWTEGKFSCMEFVDCKLTGFKLIDTQLNNIFFDRCVGKLTQFCGSSLKKVLFNECNLAGADFSDCNFEEVVFAKCDLTDTIFYNAKIAGTDFRTSDLIGLKSWVPDLNGAIISNQQALELAPQLASLLGLQVKED